MKSNTMPQSFSVSKITRAGMFIAMSVVLKMIFEFYIPIAGMNALRINLGTIPVMLSGIVLGPITGFFTGAIADLVGFIIKPSGAYFPGFTLVSAISGMLPALIYKYAKKEANFNVLNIVFSLLLTSSSFAVLILKNIVYFENGHLFYGDSPVKLVYIVLLTLLVLLYIFSPQLLTKLALKDKKDFSLDKICFIVNVTQLCSSIILNTYFLSILYNKGFLIFLPARLLTNLFMIPLYSMSISVVLNLFNRLFRS